METLRARKLLLRQNCCAAEKHADLSICHLNFGKPFATPAPLHVGGPSYFAIEYGDMRMFRMHGIWQWLQLCSKGATQVSATITGRFLYSLSVTRFSRVFYFIGCVPQELRPEYGQPKRASSLRAHVMRFLLHDALLSKLGPHVMGNWSVLHLIGQRLSTRGPCSSSCCPATVWNSRQYLPHCASNLRQSQVSG